MTASLNQIYKAIGSLETSVMNLAKAIEVSDKRASDSNKRADQHRAVIHKRVDDLVGEVGDIKTSVETMKEDVADSKVVTDEVKQWKQRGVGALFVAGIAGTAIGGVVVGFIVYWWEAILRAIRAA
ncbi:MAG: DUF1515 domain-containing protein [Mesorhizobium sp.]|uniref:DUF1515 family protein n=1 Tax=Mesorhizobium sp. TaxID=1871066 RepID=UPI000FEA851E|nr:DUF1515 family protein [Mesorhizobium sp.]RWC91632.1 MAG: DUF1515 domain-containing protein [Mesorhizobium sp.]